MGTDHEKRLSFHVTRQDQSFVIPRTASPWYACRDRLATCAEDAKRGYCQSRPGYMILNCCVACDPYVNSSELIDPKKRCSKEHLKTPDPIWRAGHLNQLFASWATDEEIKHSYGLEVISSPDPKKYGVTRDGAKIGDPWIVAFHDFLTEGEVRDLVRGGEMDKGYEQGTVLEKNEMGKMEDVTMNDVRTSSTSFCLENCRRLTGVRSATEKIERVTG